MSIPHRHGGGGEEDCSHSVQCHQQDINDDALIGKDTSGMSEDEKLYHVIRKHYVILE